MDNLPYARAGGRASARLVERLLMASGWNDLPLNLELWDGSRIALGDWANCTVRLCSRAAVLDLLRPDLERLSDAYVAGRLEFDGPAGDAVRIAIELATRRAGRAARSPRARATCTIATESLRDLPTPFCERVLGTSLASSCARFRHPDATLTESQFDGFEQVCQAVGLQPGMRLLDLDCGWGTFAIHAARRFDVSVVGLTASSERYRHASARLAGARLDDRIDIRPPDSPLSSLDERFDRVVSIDLLERSGPTHLFDRLARIEHALVPGGMALIRSVTAPTTAQGITGGGGADRSARLSLADAEWGRVAAEAAGAGLELVELESLGQHHARTLRLWSARFEANLRRLTALVGERQVRYWRTRLAGAALAFELGWVGGYQSIVRKPAPRATTTDRPGVSRRDGRARLRC